MGFVFKVKNGEVPPMPEHLSPEGKDFICSCLKLDPRARPTAAELLQHPFVANAFDISIPHSPLSPHERAQSPSSFRACGDSSPSHHFTGNGFDGGISLSLYT